MTTTDSTLGAWDSNGLLDDTNTSSFHSRGPLDQGPDPKAMATQVAQIAIAGHAVHKLAGGGYLVCKCGYTHHASDFAALQRFARRLGVSNGL